MIGEVFTPIPSSETETIAVLLPHLEFIHSVLIRAEMKSEAEDLADHYRHQRGRSPQPSRLTSDLQRATERIAGYLGILEDHDNFPSQ